MKPYYEEKGITIYHADCREVLPTLAPADLMLTDPPFEGYDGEQGRDWVYVPLEDLPFPSTRQFIFWSATKDFPLDYSAVHIWHKPNGRSNEHYERIFERNGQKVCRVWRESAINSQVAAQMCGDVFTEHPTQKPIRLIRNILLLAKASSVLDPFMGSGTTLRAAKDLGLDAVGVELNERYCEIAAKRLQQEVLPLTA